MLYTALDLLCPVVKAKRENKTTFESLLVPFSIFNNVDLLGH